MVNIQCFLLKCIIISETRKMCISASLWGRMTAIHQKRMTKVRTFTFAHLHISFNILYQDTIYALTLYVYFSCLFFKLAAKGVNFGQKILYILIAVASLLGTTLFFIQKKVAKKSVIGTSFSEKFMLFTAWDMYWFACMHKLTISS